MRKYFLTAVLLTVLSVFALGIYKNGKESSAEAFSVNAATEDEIKDELIIAIFIESITDYVKNFYSGFYSGEIAVYGYETDILEIGKTDNGLITIRFGVTPQVGAHNPLGYDELLYMADYAGNGKMTKYEHIRDYAVPPKFEEYIIKPAE